MDYQIFTFSFKFFMVLLTKLSSPLFSFVFFVTIYLFISYLFPIYCQLVFCCLTLYDHSQDHSKSRPANSNPGYSHHPPHPHGPGVVVFLKRCEHNILLNVIKP